MARRSANPAPRRPRRQKKGRLKLHRLFFVLILLGGILYGAFVALSALYDWGYVKIQGNAAQKVTIPPQFEDPRFEKYTNILIIGVDDQPIQGVSEAGRYADAVMLISMNHDTKEIRCLSLPRNIKIDIPGRKAPDYLSFTYYYGGALLTVDSVSQLLQVPITQYVAFDRKALSQLVDALGGINIYVQDDMNYDDPVGGTSIHLSRGYQHLNGDLAQQYLRYRSDDLGDIGRVQRQQKFVQALFDRLMTAETLTALPSIVHIFNSSMETNINLVDISILIDLFDTLRTSDMKVQMLPGNLSAAGEWIPDQSRIEQDMNEIFQ